MDDRQVQLLIQSLDRIAIAIEALAPKYEPPYPDPDSADDMQDRRQAFLDAYANGMVIQYTTMNPDDGRWFDVHVYASPHRFDFDANYYRMPTPRK